VPRLERDIKTYSNILKILNKILERDINNLATIGCWGSATRMLAGDAYEGGSQVAMWAEQGGGGLTGAPAG
jgi:hypothetical protein